MPHLMATPLHLEKMILAKFVISHIKILSLSMLSLNFDALCKITSIWDTLLIILSKKIKMKFMNEQTFKE